MRILTVGEEAVGYFEFEERDHDVFLCGVVLLPAHQRRGIGTEVVRWLQERARERGVPLTLGVLKVNPARALYERLGFVRTGDDEHHIHMQWLSVKEP